MFCGDDPLSSYGTVWGKLTLHALSNGIIVLLDGVQGAVPGNVRKGLVSSLHEYHQGFDAMYRLARNHFLWPGMKEELKSYMRDVRFVNRIGYRNFDHPHS